MAVSSVVTFTEENRGDYTLIHYTIDGGVMEPDILDAIAPPNTFGTGIVISGRGPTWLAAFLTHHYHPSTWLGIYDPRLKGAVVVTRHARNAPEIGEVVPVDEPKEKVAITIEL